MTKNSNQFSVYDLQKKVYLNGNFSINQEGELFEEHLIEDPRYPNVHHTILEKLDSDEYEIHWRN